MQSVDRLDTGRRNERPEPSAVRGGIPWWGTRRLAPAAVPVAVILLVIPASIAGADPTLVLWLGVFGVLIGQAVSVDLRERRIPNALTYSGTLGVTAVAGLSGAEALASAVAGAALATILTGVAWWLGRGSLGLGDVKFSAMVGGFVGAPGVAPSLLFGTGIGAILAVGVLATGRGRRATFAYGPALAAGVVISLYVTSFATAVGQP